MSRQGALDESLPPSPVLPYADLPARHSIQYERRPGGVLIVLPPPRWWWRIDVMILLALAVFAGANVYEAVIERNPRGWMSGAVMVLLLWGAIKVARQRRAVVLEVTPEIFRAENVYPLMGSDSPVAVTRRYRRADVYDVRFVAHSGNLVIRIHGHEMFECRPSLDPGLMRWIAEELRRALGLPA